VAEGHGSKDRIKKKQDTMKQWMDGQNLRLRGAEGPEHSTKEKMSFEWNYKVKGWTDFNLKTARGRRSQAQH
jgi:hypothetical protein